jgi:hypothetical protein
MLFEEGLNVSELASTIARVVTPEELAAESGLALAEAEAATLKQLWLRLEEWAEPLIDPRES